MTETDPEVWKAFVRNLEHRLAELKADLEPLTSGTAYMAKELGDITSVEVAKFKQGIANLEALIAEYRRKAKF